jgi:hypothetical protein
MTRHPTVAVHCPKCGHKLDLRVPGNDEKWDSMVCCTSCKTMFFTWRSAEFVDIRVATNDLTEVE